jgi:tRNA guanosine-2'-O-methyltransferase
MQVCKRQGYTIVGVEQTSESISLPTYSFDKRTVLLLGKEQEGIPASLLSQLDACVEIPQFGTLRSLNVHVSGAVSVYEYVKQNNCSPPVL